MAEDFLLPFFMPTLIIPNLDAAKYKAVVFDLDGTLYDLKAMQRIMRREIMGFLLGNPWKWKEIWAVYHFRKQRKKIVGFEIQDFAEAQYQWIEKSTGIPSDDAKRYISTWMYQRPQKHLAKLIYPGVHEFIQTLKNQGISVAIFSDLEAKEKSSALGLGNLAVYAATDSEISALKHNPKGLQKIAHDLGIPVSEILFIGDKVELDGICAEKAGCDFVHIKPRVAAKQFRQLRLAFLKE